MKVVVQRVLSSSVSVDNKIVGSINNGLLILVGFTYNESAESIKKMAEKIVNLRIFDDENHVMNKSLLDVGGSVLSVSQFTLYAETRKSGRRPSYIDALKGDEAIKLYELFNLELEKYTHVETGIFGADMQVSLINDGPVTIIMESDNNVKK